MDREAATRLAEGIDLADGKTAPAEVRFIEYDAATQSTIIDITLYEGRNRQVRRMLEAVGHPVRQLTRIGFGSLRLASLNSGTWRKLRPEEVDALLALAQPTPTPPKSERRVKPSGPYRPPYPRAAQETEGETRRQGDREAGEDVIPTPKPKAQSPEPLTAPRHFETRKPQGQKSEQKPDWNPGMNSGRKQGAKPGQKPASRPAAKYGPKTGGPRSPHGYEEDDNRSRPFDPSEYTRQLDHPARPATPFEKKIGRMAKPGTPGSPAGTGPDARRPAPWWERWRLEVR